MTTANTPTDTRPWIEGIEGSAAQDLIESNSRVIRVVAGPGSGKTTCLKRRIQRLVQKDKVSPTTIFVGTFTRAIAKELRESLGAQVRVSTLHSLAYELLRKYPAACQGMRLRFLLKYEETPCFTMSKMWHRQLATCTSGERPSAYCKQVEHSVRNTKTRHLLEQ